MTYPKLASTPHQLPPNFGKPGPDGTVPLNQPWYGIGFKDANIRFFKKYARFNGFASRGEFWWAYGVHMAVLVVLMIPTYIGMFVVLGGLLASLDSITSYPDRDAGAAGAGVVGVGTVILIVGVGVTMLYSWAIAIPMAAVSVRRLHDAGYSGWFYLLSFVGAAIVVLILAALETKPQKWQPTWHDTRRNGQGDPDLGSH